MKTVKSLLRKSTISIKTPFEYYTLHLNSKPLNFLKTTTALYWLNKTLSALLSDSSVLFGLWQIKQTSTEKFQTIVTTESIE